MRPEPFFYPTRFKHCFDLETFCLLSDNGDGTAKFYIAEDSISPRKASRYVKPEGRAVTYSWEEMRPA